MKAKIDKVYKKLVEQASLISFKKGIDAYKKELEYQLGKKRRVSNLRLISIAYDKVLYLGLIEYEAEFNAKEIIDNFIRCRPKNWKQDFEEGVKAFKNMLEKEI